MLFNPRCLQDHSGNSADRLPSRCYYNLLSTIGLVRRWSLGKTISLHSWGPHKFSNSSWTSPLMMPPLSTKQLDRLAPIIPTEAGMSGPWHSWGRQNVPRLALKPDPLIYDCLPNSPACFSDCFSACKTPQELPVTQLARQVDLFHLVITDNQRPETLSLPYGLTSPIKPTTQFSQAASLWTWEWWPSSLVPINLFFPHMAWSLFSSTLHYVCMEISQ
jgi:hypothetical protein